MPVSMGGGGDKRNWKHQNIVPLTAREHYLAHYLLWKFTGSKDMAFCFYSMCNANGKFISSKNYERLRRIWAERVGKRNSVFYCGGNNPRALKVVCGETKKIYGCISEASKHTGINRGNIREVIRKGPPYTAGKFHWFLYKDWIEKEYCKKEWTGKESFPLTCKQFIQRKIKNRGSACRLAVPVMCVETEETFGAISEAAEKYKINRNCISACCLGNQNIAGGYHWKYIKKEAV
jgi:hypothetical protein